MKEDLKQNKAHAIAFYKMAYEGHPAKAVELYVGSEYIQHNPLVGDGKEPFIDYFERMAKEYPEKSIEFVRSVAEGDLVALHTHQDRRLKGGWHNDNHRMPIDLYRTENEIRIVIYADHSYGFAWSTITKNYYRLEST